VLVIPSINASICRSASDQPGCEHQQQKSNPPEFKQRCADPDQRLNQKPGASLQKQNQSD